MISILESGYRKSKMSILEEEDFRKYHLSRENALKTLHLRGYNIPDHFKMTLDEFKETFEDCETTTELKDKMSEGMIFEDGGPKIMIAWITKDKASTALEISNLLERENVSHALIYTDFALAKSSTDAIARVMRIAKKRVDVWDLNESLIFAPDHHLVPTHRICSTKSQTKIFKKYGLSPNDKGFPIIKSTDPMVKYLGAVKGQLIEIERTSYANPNQKVLSYRFVE